MKLNGVLLIILGLFFSINSYGQEGFGSKTPLRFTTGSIEKNVSLKWKNPVEYTLVDQKKISAMHFEGGLYNGPNNAPSFRVVQEVIGPVTDVEVDFVATQTSNLSSEEKKCIDVGSISDDFKLDFALNQAGKRKYIVLEIIPVRYNRQKLEKLVDFTITIIPIFNAATRDGNRSTDWKSTSVLNSGNWYKVKTGEDGIYKMTFSMLRKLGVSSTSFASSQLRLYGTGGGELKVNNDDKRPDDLYQMAISIEDGGDGSFDPGDYFLFYGEDQILWERTGNTYRHIPNHYSDSAAYFISIDGGAETPMRIVSESVNAHNATVATYDFLDLHEDNSSNLIKSGRDWYGEQLGLIEEEDFGFSIPNVRTNEDARVRCRFAARSVSIEGAGITFSMPSQGGVSQTETVNAAGSSYGSVFAHVGNISLNFKPRSGDFLAKAKIVKAGNSSAQVWIDYITIHARRELSFIEPQMVFRDSKSLGTGVVNRYELKRAPNDIRVWDITNPRKVRAQNVGVSGGAHRFSAAADSLRTFLAFTESSFKRPALIGQVEKQNLHGLGNIDYLVITHKNFETYARELTDYHTERDGFTTAVIDVEHIYNEFSGGVQDITAIKEFVRMLYFRSRGSSNELKYLLLFGDASYDYKDRVSGNSNFVPSHQTPESLLPTSSVVSDDYYGLLSEGEGESTTDLIDIAIGRLPARNKNEAQQMVSKILHYSNSDQTFGDWRNWVALVADDPEYGRATFQTQSSTLAELADSLSPEFNFEKIYLDGYKQLSGSGGERYPDVSEAISERVRKGALMMYYIGHGGELGWAHERVLDVPTINKWSNRDNMPLFITATCEFTRYDDPRRTSAGEYVMLNPSGGGVALLTTTRAVFAGPNFDLTYSFTRQAFESLESDKARLGDMTAQTKVENAASGVAGFNTRCFTLMGDPAMRLAFPQQRVLITSRPDTMQALDKVKVSGIVADKDGNRIESFNGLVYPTVFDKVSTIQGQNNDGEGLYFYEERRNILFKGKASVKNGRFSFEFVVPKDIDRSYGTGKISLYADNGNYDATGQNSDFLIGGLSDNPVDDNDGPDVDLYLNDNQFVFGGMTNQEPDLYAEVWDENGINMVGTGIGHDITAVLDDKGANTIVLNEYYEADIDSYQSGKIRYPFNELTEGRHTLKLQVWDVNNNPTDAYTEFVVANDAVFALDHILNYPNPFTTNTDFYFEHNKPGLSLDVRIEIFTVSGKLIKTIDGNYLTNGYRVGPINWNGRDHFGDPIGKGVYLYRLKVKTPVGEVAEEFERLVILN